MKVFEGTDKEYYMDGYLSENLNTAKDKIKSDWDMVFTVDGAEGSGKSVLTLQMAYYCDPSDDLIERTCFNAFQFRKVIKNAKPFQAVIYDEAHAGLNSRAAMSFINRALVSMLTEIRQKNLFVFIVLPTFFDLDRYVALWRSRALIHVYTSGSFERGYFAFYNSDKKKDLYLQGKKLYQYNVCHPNFTGRFTNYYTVDQKKYRALKADSLKKSESGGDDAELKKAFTEMLWKRLLKIGDRITNQTKADLLCVGIATYYRWMEEWKATHEETEETSVEDSILV